MRKLTNNFKQQDTTTKVGLTIVATFILPMLIFVASNIDPNTISFGF